MGEWVSVEDRLPSKRGWYLVHFTDGYKGERAYDDTYTNYMKVAYFRGKTFPYDNHYHKVDYWMCLPPVPGQVTLDV